MLATVVRNTTVEEMMRLKAGDRFVINGKRYTASSDAHIPEDASYDGYMVLDEDGESWFDSDFA